jgi:hypothetical protein
MRRLELKRRILLAAALLLGAVVPGCNLWTPPGPARLPASLGAFCAAPAGSSTGVCVSTQDGPQRAWDAAAAKGGPPIQMWAVWPSAVSLDDLVQQEDKLARWFQDVDTVLAFVRGKGAESYKASLGGTQAALLQAVQAKQAQLLAQPQVDPAGDFKKALADKAKAEKDPLVADLATDKQTMAAVQAVLDKAQADAAPLATAYAAIATQFQAYRASEAAETQGYGALAQQASAASLADLPAAEQAIVAASKSTSSAGAAVTMAAIQLFAQIQAFQTAAQAKLAPYADFLSTHGVAMPDMTSAALRSLSAMAGYVQQRVARSDATAIALLDGIAMRRKALELLAGNAAADPEVAEAQRAKAAEVQRAKAAALFQAEANAQLAALAHPPPSSARWKLPYLAARHDQLARLLQLRPLCETAASSWREAGCSSLRAAFGAAATEIQKTLPALLSAGLSAMHGRGADPALLSAAQAQLDRGDVKGAALAYDAAVRSTEGT